MVYRCGEFPNSAVTENVNPFCHGCPRSPLVDGPVEGSIGARIASSLENDFLDCYNSAVTWDILRPAVPDPPGGLSVCVLIRCCRRCGCSRFGVNRSEPLPEWGHIPGRKHSVGHCRMGGSSGYLGMCGLFSSGRLGYSADIPPRVKSRASMPSCPGG